MPPTGRPVLSGLAALAFLAACVAPPDPGGGAGGSPDDSAAPPYEVEAVEAEALEAVSTVIRVTWTSPEALVSWVEFGETEALGQRSNPSPAASEAHAALLLGMPADTTVYYQLVHEDAEGTELRSEVFTAETGALPSAFPVMDLRIDTAPLESWIVSGITGAAWAPVIFDGLGRPVWYHLETRGYNVYRTRLSRDRRAVLYNAVGVGDIDLIRTSEIVRVGLDGTVEASYTIPFMTHDFVELPNGDLVAIAYDVREVDGVEIRGDQLVRVDIETGENRTLFSTWDHWDPSTHGYDDGDDTWTHANALDYDEDEDCFYLSVRDLGSVVKLDARTGELLWGLSGDANDFTFTEGEGWEIQHQFERVGDRFLVFDNGDADRAASYVQEYTLDEEARTAELTFFHEPQPRLFVWALGDVDPIDPEDPESDLLITWATAGLYHRVDRTGALTWELASPLSYALGYTSLEDSLYPE